MVFPLPRFGAAGDIMASDPSDSRILHFSRAGNILWKHSSRDEVETGNRIPVAAAKFKDDYWIADAENGISIVSPQQPRRPRRLPKVELAIGDAVQVGDTVFVVGGQSKFSKGQTSWLRGISVSSGRDQWRALSPTLSIPQKILNAYGKTLISKFERHLFVAVSVVDSIYVLDAASGELLAKRGLGLPLHLPPVLIASRERPPDYALKDFRRISAIAMMDSASLLVQLSEGTGRQSRSRWFIGRPNDASPFIEIAARGVLLSGDDGRALGISEFTTPVKELTIWKRTHP